MIKTFTLRYPEELKAELMRYVKQRGGTMNGLILTILWGWVKAQHENGDPPTNKEIERRKTR